ncbi:MAG: tetratricopeptide repeat protein [Mariprofundus sp.]|nr:tetratricopeptide repeat protein [Mariprofundus sp.]
MNDKTSKKVTVMPEDSVPLQNSPLQEEMNELKREMRSAKWFEWVQSHQNLIIGAVAGLVIALMVGGLWIEKDQAQSAAAATLYQQAVNEKDSTSKQAMLEKLTSQFSGNSYAALAMMQLARVDPENAETHLQNLIQNDHAMEEWVWQARLDLAEIKIAKGDQAAARVLLDKVVGKQYQQLRYYLLAELSDDVAEKNKYLQQALDAKSNDNELKQKIKTLLPQQAA